MPSINESEQSGQMVPHETLDPLGSTPTETPKSLAEEHEGTTSTIQDDSADNNDDMIMMPTSSGALATKSADFLAALGATYAATVNGVRCFLSSAHEYAELVQSVLAVAATTITTTTNASDRLTIWFKCTFSKQDLLLQEDCFEKYRYKLVNGYVAATTDGAVIFDVLTEDAAFRAPGSPTPPPPVSAPAPTVWNINSSSSRAPSPEPAPSTEQAAEHAQSLQPAEATIISEDGSSAHPITIDDDEEDEDVAPAAPASTIYSISSSSSRVPSPSPSPSPEVAPATPAAHAASARKEQTPNRRGHHSVPLRRSPPAPTRIEKRRSSCPPRFSKWQTEQIAHLFSGSRDDPIVIY